MARDGWSETEADQRIASQISIEEKAARADHVIDTSGTFDETTRQVRDVWTKLRDAASQPR
jgi:dephospho-CoA kinase